MAAEFISMNPVLPDVKTYQSDLQELAQWVRQGKSLRIFRQRDKILKMRDGDGFNAAHYALVTTKFGTATDAKSQTLFNEIDATCGAITSSTIDDAALQLEALTQLQT